MLTLKDKLLLFLDFLSEQDIFCPRRYLAKSFSSYEYTSVDQGLRELIRKEVISVERGKNSSIKLKIPLRDFWKNEVFDRRRFLKGWEWDGLWRIVLFDIAEEQRRIRDITRRKLKSLGFSMFQRSVWVTPFNVATELSFFLKEAGLKGPVEILEGKRLFISDEKALAENLWNLRSVNREYKKLLDNDPFTFEDYLKVKINDPLLPDELLIKPWYGKEVEKRLVNTMSDELI